MKIKYFKNICYYWVVVILVIFLFSHFEALAQSDSSSIENEILIETISGGGDQEIKFDFSKTSYLDLLKHPININKATAEQISKIEFLKDIEINAILNYRKLNGNFITIYELQNVDNLPLTTIKAMLPYIKIDGEIDDYKVPIRDYFTAGNHQLTFLGTQVLERSEGYKYDSSKMLKPYMGSPNRIFIRYRYTFSNKFSVSFLGDKDPGEELFKGNQKKGFDFYSGHLYFQTNSFISAVAIGDYEIRMGQGLAYYTGFGIGKSPLFITIKKESPVLKAYTSANEINYSRGIAFTLKYKKVTLTPFFSYKNRDANIAAIDSNTAEVAYVSSLLTSGYHRTLNELADKNAIKIKCIGAYATFKSKALKIGIGGVNQQLSQPLQNTPHPYNKFDFVGKQLSQATIDYSYVWQNLNLFGETAISDNGGWATMHALLAGLDKRLDGILLYRNYQANYQSLQANAFAEGSSPSNESGIFGGLSAKPFSGWQISGYTDLFTFPWLRFGVDAPSKGHDYLLQATYKPTKAIELYWRINFKTKQTNSPSLNSDIGALLSEDKLAARFNFAYKLSKAITIKNRADWNQYQLGNNKATQGFAIYQDLSYAPMGLPFSISGRVNLYNTTDYNTRVYAFENDVLGSFSVPALYGHGVRWYIMTQYTIARKIDFWFRIAQTNSPYQTTIGSGLDLINNNHKTEVKLQVRLRI
jgi:DNA uptake protein ComE-like DNA-binding protein